MWTPVYLLLGLCVGPEGLMVPALGHTWYMCKSSMASPLGGDTYFIFSWCIWRVSSCPVSSGTLISCSRAT